MIVTKTQAIRASAQIRCRYETCHSTLFDNTTANLKHISLRDFLLGAAVDFRHVLWRWMNSREGVQIAWNTHSQAIQQSFSERLVGRGKQTWGIKSQSDYHSEFLVNFINASLLWASTRIHLILGGYWCVNYIRALSSPSAEWKWNIVSFSPIFFWLVDRRLMYKG